MNAILLIGVEAALQLLVCWLCWRLGVRAAIRVLKDEYGWWTGFRAGCTHAVAKMQEQALKQGIVINMADTALPTNKDN